MICPCEKKKETSVIDSRPSEDGTSIRRRRLCVCGERFTTFERVQFRELTVVKKNGRKSSFDREKLSKSIYIALKKRPIDSDTVEKFITKISRSLEELGQSEISSSIIGTMVMDGLKEFEKIGELITKTINGLSKNPEDNSKVEEEVRGEVVELCSKFPIYKHLR